MVGCGGVLLAIIALAVLAFRLVLSNPGSYRIVTASLYDSLEEAVERRFSYDVRADQRRAFRQAAERARAAMAAGRMPAAREHAVRRRLLEESRREILRPADV